MLRAGRRSSRWLFGSFKGITGIFDGGTDHEFVRRSFYGEGLPGGTGIGLLYAGYVFDGPDDGGLAVGAVHAFHLEDGGAGSGGFPAAESFKEFHGKGPFRRLR